jgi:hypothetical protein
MRSGSTQCDSTTSSWATQRSHNSYEAMTQRATIARLAPLSTAILQVLTPVLPLLGVGMLIGDQSDEVRSLITPAGWAFSIWSVLYAGSLIFAVFQALPSQQDNILVAGLRWPAAGAFLGNALWALYTQFYGLSAVSSAIIMLTLLCLLVVYRRLSSWRRMFGRGELWCAYVPLSALASWLTAATIVNVTASLRFHGVEAGDATPMIAAAVLVIGGAIAAFTVRAGQGNLPYAVVFLWALAAIYASGGRDSTLVAGAAAISAVFVIVGAVVGRVKINGPPPAAV